MPSIATSFPFARSQIDTGMSGGGVHHLWLSGPPCSCTSSRWRSQSMKSTRSRTPTMRSAMMSDQATSQHLGDGVRGNSHGLHPVFQPSGAMLPSLRMKMMNVRPAVTRNAPSQSMRLSSERASVRTLTTGGLIFAKRLLVWQRVWDVRVDRDVPAEAAQRTEPRHAPECRTPGLSVIEVFKNGPG